MKFTKEMVMRVIREEIAKYTNESIEEIDPQHERHEGLISVLYDMMLDNATGDQEQDLEAAKIELIDDGKATEEELSKIELDHILQMKGPLAMGEGRYSDYDWNIPGNPSPMDVYDMQQRYDRARQRKSKKPSGEPSAEEQKANWREWQDLHPYEEVTPSQKASIMRNGKAGWPAP